MSPGDVTCFFSRYELQHVGGDPVELVSSAESLTVDYASNAPDLVG